MRNQFDHNLAFNRNLGWVTKDELQTLRNAKVAIAGAGGVGGIHLITLIRLGISRFHIADPDTFEIQNFNRQYGADLTTVGHNKCEVMEEKAKNINPDLEIKSFPKGVLVENLESFLDGVDIYVDGLDLFEIKTREFLFAECRRRNIPCISVAPVGMGAAMIAFTAESMSFEDYFGVTNQQDPLEKVMRFTLGMAPSLVHLKSLVDRTYSNLKIKKVSSTPMGCHLASGVMGTEVLKLLLKRGPQAVAPTVIHYDAYSYQLKKTKVFWGHRNPLFQIKLMILKAITNRLQIPQNDSKENSEKIGA